MTRVDVGRRMTGSCPAGNPQRSWVAERGAVNLPGLHLLRNLGAAWLPNVCLLCDLPCGPVPNLCAACAGELPRLGRQARGRRVAFAYRPPVSTLVQWMKFEGNLPAARALGVLLAQSVAQSLADSGEAVPDAIVPVPLHRDRLRSRGFNQAVELARPLARRLGRPLLARTCVRTRATLPQSSLASASARRRNVAGAFGIATPVTGLRHVAIVDDVVTTGATARELARTLRAAGITRIVIWACAGKLPA